MIVAHQSKEPEYRAFIASGVVARERSHRRAAVSGVLVLLSLGVLPVVVDYVPTGLDAALTGVDHLGALCLAALHVLLEPVHGGFHLVLSAGIAYAAWDRWRGWRKLRRTVAAGRLNPSLGRRDMERRRCRRCQPTQRAGRCRAAEPGIHRG